MVKQNHQNWDGATLYYQYIKDISRYPLLNRKEETELLKRVQEGDRKAINKLVCSNLKFVINVAFLYKNQGFTLPELINEGNLGLIEAARRFDLSRKIKFISYAVWWIRQSITRAIAERSRVVRISAEKELVLRRFAKFNVPVRQVVGGSQQIDTDELGKRAGYPKAKVEEILEMGSRHSSLDEPINPDEGVSVIDITIDDSVESPDLPALEHSDKHLMTHLLDQLNAQEKRVLSMYFGIDYPESLNLEEIGKIIGLSKERVRQIKEKGLANLRSMNATKELASTS